MQCACGLSAGYTGWCSILSTPLPCGWMMKRGTCFVAGSLMDLTVPHDGQNPIWFPCARVRNLCLRRGSRTPESPVTFHDENFTRKRLNRLACGFSTPAPTLTGGIREASRVSGLDPGQQSPKRHPRLYRAHSFLMAPWLRPAQLKVEFPSRSPFLTA